jgi:prepilin-type N-terminal cleavage/methylation domain-containing protein
MYNEPARLPRRSSRAGFSLVEMVIALGIIAIALTGMISVIHYSSRSNYNSRERMLALRAAERKIEEMGSHPFKQIFQEYYVDRAVRKLDIIEVPGLKPVKGATSVGVVRFPVDAGGKLLEDLTGKLMDPVGNKPSADIDIDGDGAINVGVDKSGDYELLPVSIELSWNGTMGPTSLVIKHLLRSK